MGITAQTLTDASITIRVGLASTLTITLADVQAGVGGKIKGNKQAAIDWVKQRIADFAGVPIAYLRIDIDDQNGKFLDVGMTVG